MIHTFHIDSSNPFAKSLIDFLATLDFVKHENNSVSEFELSDEQLEIINERRENRISGKSTTHSWDEVKDFARNKKG